MLPLSSLHTASYTDFDKPVFRDCGEAKRLVRRMTLYLNVLVCNTWRIIVSLIFFLFLIHWWKRAAHNLPFSRPKLDEQNCLKHVVFSLETGWSHKNVSCMMFLALKHVGPAKKFAKQLIWSSESLKKLHALCQ